MNNKLKNIVKAVVFPPKWFCLIFGIVSVTCSVVILVCSCQIVWLSYICYALSLLGLWYLIIAVVIPLWKKANAALYRIPVMKRYRRDAVFRLRINLYFGLIFNIAYALFKLIFGIYYHSMWFIAIAFYYMVLICIKAYPVCHDIRIVRSKQEAAIEEEWRIYRITGWLLMLLNIGLIGIGTLVVYKNQSYDYPGFLIFAMAAYTFYCIVSAIICVSKALKSSGPLLATTKYIDLCLAVIAMYTLQTAMLATFSNGMNARIPNAVTGAVAAIIVTVIAVSMILKASKQIKNCHTD